MKSQGEEDRFHYLCQGMPFVSLEKGKKTRATLPHHIKLSETKDFGLHTGLNVSSLLILQKKFDFSTNSSKKKWPVVKSGMIGLFHNMVQNDKK